MYDDSQQQAIEKEFRQSWDMVERHLQIRIRNQQDVFLPLLELVRGMRQLGYEDWFRIDWNGLQFIASRSFPRRRSRLKAYLLIGYRNKEYYAVGRFGGTEYRFNFNTITLTSELKTLLELLMAQPIE